MSSPLKKTASSPTVSSPLKNTHIRSTSPPSPRPAKRAKHDHLTKDDFKNGVFLAPMVRSGALPTRLFALAHGATLVWGPEMVDKAILHATRVVDPITGVVSFEGKSRAMFTTHPIEKPYLIYQIGSSDPALAVQAAQMVMNDVSGIDLNCGCPKPFSTHSGMGAALLSTPDLLCDILRALRAAMPPHITVTAKIRLLPSQEDTLKLVEKIVNTGVSALTVHCRTREMRDRHKALIGRLREIVDFVEGMGKGIAVVENGDCESWEDAKRVRLATGASSVMIARGAESNPTCFSETPLTDLEIKFLPEYIRLSQYLGNHYGLTKFCASQFKSTITPGNKEESKRLKQAMIKGKRHEEVESTFGPWTGKQVFDDIVKAIETRGDRRMILDTSVREPITTEVELTTDAVPPSLAASLSTNDESSDFVTPPSTQNPEPVGPGAPLLSSNVKLELDRGRWGHEPATPTPTSATA
ncbi:tRNA-dihydrouridine synthase 2 [Pterulicium gracile]|uniref:tRNA-dihydrouridine synthase 2 n=1 Tax=Pterulicium gracile TaxID=1884261 RepID=A0A5C3QT57_9AGAR|nr:tRNA-dihydrouridine synthase 2 [Pterula gracilis]